MFINQSITAFTHSLMTGPSGLKMALSSPVQIREEELRQGHDFLTALAQHLPSSPVREQLSEFLKGPSSIDSLSRLAEILQTLDATIYLQAAREAMLALGLQVYFSPASTALLQDFNLSSLMSDAHQATYEIRSANEELKLLPAFLKNIPEGEKIFELIQHPSTQATQILQRQTLVEALVDSSQLDSLKDLKNGAYYLNQGVDLLFRRYVEIDEYTRMSVIEAYRSGYQERVASDIEAGI